MTYSVRMTRTPVILGLERGYTNVGGRNHLSFLSFPTRLIFHGTAVSSARLSSMLDEVAIELHQWRNACVAGGNLHRTRECHETAAAALPLP